MAIRTAAKPGTLPVARLEQVELACLDRELEVLHVPVALSREGRGRRAAPRRPAASSLRADWPEPSLASGPRRADPGDDVLALRVRQELAVEANTVAGQTRVVLRESRRVRGGTQGPANAVDARTDGRERTSVHPQSPSMGRGDGALRAPGGKNPALGKRRRISDPLATPA